MGQPILVYSPRHGSASRYIASAGSVGKKCKCNPGRLIGCSRGLVWRLADNVKNTKQRLLGYLVALHHETDHRFVYHFVERRLGAALSVTPHVSSAISEV